MRAPGTVGWALALSSSLAMLGQGGCGDGSEAGPASDGSGGTRDGAGDAGMGNAAGAAAETGRDSRGSCASGLVECGASCVDTSQDREHCGACEQACASGEICLQGRCEVSCQQALTLCDGLCTDTLRDREHCGDCQRTCASGEICDAGRCVLSCQGELVECDGVCIDPGSDELHCGASGDCRGDRAGSVCAAGEKCDGNGACALDCSSGSVECDGFCVNPQTDQEYCGASDDCRGDNAGRSCGYNQYCDAGACALWTSCEAILERNDDAADGVYEVDLGAGAQRVYCDMESGGITYLELAIGQYDLEHEGYFVVTLEALEDPPTQSAFVELYNMQGYSMRNLDVGFSATNCCIKPSTENDDRYWTFGGATEYVYPASTNNVALCNEALNDDAYRFFLASSGSFAPIPMSNDFFAQNPPGVGDQCEDLQNPAWFFRVLE